MVKQTIFITINRAYIARNLLLNDFMKLLSEKYRVVIFTPLFDDNDFKIKFSQYGVEPLLKRPLIKFKKRIEQALISMHRALIYNSSSEVFTGFGRGLSVNGDLRNNGELVKYKIARHILAKYIFGKLLARDFIRNFFKFIDKIILPCSLYDNLINKYKPSLVFISALGGDDEVALLRNCRNKNIPSIGMAGSWDNLSKWGFREKVDLLAVWSDYMKDEALRFQGYNAKNIVITGVPQFDHYVNPNINSKDEFIKKFQLDPTKKIIFFGSEGPVCTEDPYIVSFLKQKIKGGVLADFQILVRPHFSYGQRDLDRFKDLVDNETVFMDIFYEKSNFKDGTALTLNTAKNLIAEIVYSDAAITSTSTLVLDIIANGKQPILYNFDQDKNKQFKESTRRLYDTLWFKEILKFQLDNIADSEEELIAKIMEITQNAGKDLGKREALIQRLCYKLDGQGGKRLFIAVDSFLQQNSKYE